MNNQLTRRNFLATTSAASASALFYQPASAAQDRPNILWITSEDNGPELGCYGDSYADTPNIDKIATQGVRYLNAWSTAPVCAPARTTIISGVYPPCTGSEHMRSMTQLPDNMKMFPVYLRQAGYYCTNRNKEDYNIKKTGKVWDDSSKTAHWRNRKPDQPFFSVINFTTSHESQLRKRPHTPVHDAAKVRVPAYHPDTPEVRRDWAQYYDKITEMDAQVGKVMQQLEEDGLTDNTIVFYYGDHGSGMPRSKRWPYNSGLHVPIIVSIPEKFKHLASPDYTTAGQSDRIIGFIDLAPTVLSIAGIKPPAYMQGNAFQGEFCDAAQPFGYGFRGRMDERYDMVRTVRDKRYIYIRNYMPHKIYGQYINYMFQTPTTNKWKELYDKGELKPPRTYFWETKPPEEFYDLEKDQDEVNNLIDSPDHQDIIKRLRSAQQKKALDIRDVGFLPEDEVHSRSKGSTPYEMGHDASKYSMDNIFAMADAASNLKDKFIDKCLAGLANEDSAVRYWGAMGILMREEPAVKKAAKVLRKSLSDKAPAVRIIAAQALGQYGSDKDARKALKVLLELAPIDKNGVYLSMMSLNAIDAMGERAKSAKDIIAAFPQQAPSTAGRMRGYVPRLLEKINTNLQ